MNSNTRSIARISEVHPSRVFLELTNGKTVYVSAKDVSTSVSPGDIVTFLPGKTLPEDVGVPLLSFPHKGENVRVPYDMTVMSVFDYEDMNVMKRVIERTIVSQRNRYRVYLRDDFTCQKCKYRAEYSLKASYHIERATWKFYLRDWNPLTIDHIFPVSKGGKNHVDNYQTMCQKCNQEKADIILERDDAEEFLKYVK